MFKLFLFFFSFPIIKHSGGIVFFFLLPTSFLALVLRKITPEDLNDYRPISLIGSVYKIISKVLDSKLKWVLNFVISSTQFCFLREILDGVLMINEIIDWKKLAKKCVTLIKG